jgi:hypothetical protein
MISAHTAIECQKYVSQYFPKSHCLVIPPPSSWTTPSQGTIFAPAHPENCRDYDLAAITIPCYDTPGTLEIHCEYAYYDSNKKHDKRIEENYIFYIKGPFSREDISLIMTLFDYGDCNEFVSYFAELAIPETPETLKRDITNQWMTAQKVIFCPHEKQLYYNQDMAVWRDKIPVILEKDYDTHFLNLKREGII